MNRRAFTLIEVLVSATIALILGVSVTAAGWKTYEKSSLAVSANNIRQLTAGATAYLADHQHTFWPYRSPSLDPARPGVIWWFGLEPSESLALGEGNRLLDPSAGPLGDYVPAGCRRDPSFQFTGRAFKPKYRSGYIGVAYNVLLGGGWLGNDKLKSYWELADPREVVVFTTAAQVNTFQSPATVRNPMIEEFYGIDQREITVHFRHASQAMVGFANGSAGFLPMDESTRDPRAPASHVGRFAPAGSKKYLE